MGDDFLKQTEDYIIRYEDGDPEIVSMTEAEKEHRKTVSGCVERSHMLGMKWGVRNKYIEHNEKEV